MKPFEEQSESNLDYFSFFQSHDKVLLKPESNFVNIKKFMNFLPVDYYVLLQNNFETKAKFKESNYVMFQNMPLLQPAKSGFGEKMKQVTYEDLR